jgi:hypothetical protein
MDMLFLIPLAIGGLIFLTMVRAASSLLILHRSLSPRASASFFAWLNRA